MTALARGNPKGQLPNPNDSPFPPGEAGAAISRVVADPSNPRVP
jgi:hypothetical protein